MNDRCIVVDNDDASKTRLMGYDGYCIGKRSQLAMSRRHMSSYDNSCGHCHYGTSIYGLMCSEPLWHEIERLCLSTKMSKIEESRSVLDEISDNTSTCECAHVQPALLF